MEKHQIYELFSSLMASLAINRPSSPTKYIIQKLTSEDPCKICVISNDPDLSTKCVKMLEQQFKAKVYSISPDATPQEVDDQIKALQSATNFILQNHPQNKKQALHLLDSRVIPDRVFLVSKHKMSALAQDQGEHDLIALSNVFKHNTRIICCDEGSTDDLELEQMLMSGYFEQRRSFNNYLAPRFAPRVLVLGPPHSGKTKLAMALRDRMNVNYLNAAHVLNRHIQFHTELGIEAETQIKSGQEVGDKVVVGMIAEDICNDSDFMVNGYAMDHFPRTVDQAKAMLQCGVTPNRVIVLTAKDSSIMLCALFLSL